MIRLLLVVFPLWFIFYLFFSNWKSWNVSTTKKVVTSLGYAILASVVVLLVATLIVVLG